MAGGIILTDKMGPVLDYLVISAAQNIAEAMEQGKRDLEAHAKGNAPWADFTGAARNGLTASVTLEAGIITLTLAHSVDYGKWLELIQDGRFAIILPTLEALAPQIFRDAGARATSIKATF